jgi:hypothetical protein
MDGVPQDYWIVVPDGWFRVSLEPGERERSAKALANKVLRGIDNAPRTKAKLRSDLLDQAMAAYLAGGIEMYASLMQAAGYPLSASLLISLTPPPPSGPVSQHHLASACTGNRRSVELGTVAGRPAIRVRATTTPENGPTVTNQDVHIQVPGSGAWLLPSFSTPIQELAAPLLDLFDAIAGTFAWIP